uniref:Uncharacterized protein n=1 Tax=Trichuris muris TaxID=70415 RepID=A0A5S6QK29_TRIMR
MGGLPRLTELSALCSCQEDLISKLEVQLQSYRSFTEKLKNRLRAYLEDEGQLFRCLEAAQLAGIPSNVGDNATLEKAEALYNNLSMTASKLEKLTEAQEKLTDGLNSADLVRLANLAYKYWDANRELDFKAEEYKKSFEERCLQADELRRAEVDLYRDQLKQVNQNFANALRDLEVLNAKSDVHEDQMKTLANVFKKREEMLENDVVKYQADAVSVKLENNDLKCKLESIRGELQRAEQMKDVEVTSLRKCLEEMKRQHRETYSNLIAVQEEALRSQERLSSAETELHSLRKKQRIMEEALRHSVTELKEQLMQSRIYYQQQRDAETFKLKRLLQTQSMIITQLKIECMKATNRNRRAGKK